MLGLAAAFCFWFIYEVASGGDDPCGDPTWLSIAISSQCDLNLVVWLLLGLWWALLIVAPFLLAGLLFRTLQWIAARRRAAKGSPAAAPLA